MKSITKARRKTFLYTSVHFRGAGGLRQGRRYFSVSGVMESAGKILLVFLVLVAGNSLAFPVRRSFEAVSIDYSTDGPC